MCVVRCLEYCIPLRSTGWTSVASTAYRCHNVSATHGQVARATARARPEIRQDARLVVKSTLRRHPVKFDAPQRRICATATTTCGDGAGAVDDSALFSGRAAPRDAVCSTSHAEHQSPPMKESYTATYQRRRRPASSWLARPWQQAATCATRDDHERRTQASRRSHDLVDGSPPVSQSMSSDTLTTSADRAMSAQSEASAVLGSAADQGRAFGSGTVRARDQRIRTPTGPVQ